MLEETLHETKAKMEWLKKGKKIKADTWIQLCVASIEKHNLERFLAYGQKLWWNAGKLTQIDLVGSKAALYKY